MGRFIYHAASYWHRHCDTLGTAVALQSSTWGLGPKAVEAVAKAIQEAIKEEIERCTDVPDDELIEPDICYTSVHPCSAEELFTAAELRSQRQALQSGEVVWMSQG